MSTIFTFGLSTESSSVYGNEIAFICNNNNNNGRQKAHSALPPFCSSLQNQRNFALSSSSSNSNRLTGSSTTAAFQPWRNPSNRRRRRRRKSLSTSLPVFFQNRDEPEPEDLTSLSSPPLSISSAGEDISFSSPHSSPAPSERRRLRRKLNQSNTALFALFKRFNPRAASSTESDDGVAVTAAAWKNRDEKEDDDDDEGCLVLEHAATGKTESICFDAIKEIDRGGAKEHHHNEHNIIEHHYDEKENGAKEDIHEEEQYHQEEIETSEETRMEFDVPAIPSYKLPDFIPSHEESIGNDSFENDDENEEDIEAKMTWLTQQQQQNNDDEVNQKEEYNKEEEKAINGERQERKETKKHVENKVNRGIIIMDNFSPFHGQYISRMAREAYNAGVVSVLSNYVTGYLYQERGLTDHLSMRLPSDEHIEEWVSSIPFEIVGVVCESDSGLDDAERLGEMLGLYPDRHDGYNLARRNKFLMMEVMKEYGLKNVVQQRLCRNLEEALEFAKELGVRDEEEKYHRDEAINGDTDGDGTEDENEITGESPSSSSVDLIIGEEKSEGELLDEMEKEEIEEQIIQQKSIEKENELMESIMDDTDDNAAEQHDTFTAEEEVEEKHKSNSGLLGLPKIHGRLNKPTYCVVKPMRGVASDDVHLCPNLQTVSTAFNKIYQSSIFGTMNGEKHDSVLVQEFASGTEYAVDIVSKGGQHKVAALWKYDKRSVNGAPFVYHATELVDADTRVGRAVCEYAMEALDALNVHWGMSHTEIIVEEENDDDDDDDDGEIRPRLVEVNCRQHNTDFAPLTTAAVGYNTLDMLLSAYLGDADDFPPHTEHMRLIWNDLPDLPVTRAYGAIVHLVSHVEGVIKEVNYDALEEIENMDSVMAMEVYQRFLSAGNEIEKTVDIRTDTGWVHIMNNDEEQFLKDYNRILELVENMFIVEKAEGDGVEAGAEMKINGESMNGANAAASSSTPVSAEFEDVHDLQVNEGTAPISIADFDE